MHPRSGARCRSDRYYYVLRYQQTATSLVAPDGTCVGHTAYGEEALLVADLDPEAATGWYARRYAPDRYGE